MVEDELPQVLTVSFKRFNVGLFGMHKVDKFVEYTKTGFEAVH